MVSHARQWTVRTAPRRVHPLIEIRNTRGTVAVVYTDTKDAGLMAASPRLLHELKALVRAKPFTPAWETECTRAKALIAELEA